MWFNFGTKLYKLHFVFDMFLLHIYEVEDFITVLSTYLTKLTINNKENVFYLLEILPIFTPILHNVTNCFQGFSCFTNTTMHSCLLPRHGI